MIRGLPRLAALVGAMLLACAAARAEDNPHADLGACAKCHVETPRKGRVTRPLRFKKDIVSLCLDCHHEKDVANLHPVDIRPGMDVPPALPLDEEQTITCATCHDPHMPSEADNAYVAEALTSRLLSIFTRKDRYRTFFLRQPNPKGELCSLCHTKGTLAQSGFHTREASILDQYVGSGRCGSCHGKEYAQWRLTPHARMARDPKKNPEAILGDFIGDPPFQKSDISLTLGVRWTQRYVTNKNGRNMVKAPIWSVMGNNWDRSYWSEKPWDQFCQGCHTTGFEMKGEPKYAELSIGCEACHGPGRAHADAAGRKPIVNPAKLTADRREMICEACHTSGHDRTGQFRFPLGYLPGKDLTYYYKGLTPKPGQDNETFEGDDSYADRRRQWNFWVDAYMNPRGLTCDICKNFRERKAKAETVKMTVNEHCLTCHQGKMPADALHKGHLADEVQCVSCHQPSVARDGTRYSIHDHKFLFGAPAKPKAVPTAQACVGCHPGKKG